MEHRYPALGTVAVLYQIAGVIVIALAAFALLVAVLSLQTPTVSAYSTSIYAPFAFAGLIAPIVGLLAGIGLYASGELINLFRDMELNSRIAAQHAQEQAEYARRSASALEQLVQRRQLPPQQPSTPNQPPRPQ